MNTEYFRKIDNIINENLSHRGFDQINIKGQVEKAAKELWQSTTVIIVTGFVIRASLIGETDGPIGTISLASALEKLGKKVILVTDKYSANILSSCCLVKGVTAPLEIIPYTDAEKFCLNLLINYKPSHVVSIERPGRARDGHFYSMLGESLSDIVPNTDILFEKAHEQGITTISVGDGGNELGMGKVSLYIQNHVYKGDRICAYMSCDYLIIACVSNWGGHALTAALSILSGVMLLHDKGKEVKIMESMIAAGAVDGCTKKRSLSVDGFSLEENLEILDRLRNVVWRALKFEYKSTLAL